jgi:integrase
MTSECRTFVRDLWSLALAIGMRLSELLALRWADVHLDSGVITVARAIERTKAGLRVKAPKAGKPRKDSIPQSVCVQLRSMQKRQKEIWLSLGVRPASEHEALLLPASPDMPEALMKPPAASARFREASDAFGLSLRHIHVSVLLKELWLLKYRAEQGIRTPP